MYKRFWFEFDIDVAWNYPPGIGYGCGVTAIDLDDAIEIMNRKVFSEIKMPTIKRIVEDVDIRTLDQGHVTPNMKPPIYRGIWFPIGYDYSF